MALEIRPYREADRPLIAQFLQDLQAELVAMDELHRLWCPPGCGVALMERCLQDVQARRGRLLVAELNGRPVAFAAGVIEHPPPRAAWETRSRVGGRVIELYVEPAARGAGIGRCLLERLEEYFVDQGCDAIRIEVFAPNREARRFYERWGYRERDVHLMRPLNEEPLSDPPLPGPADRASL
jgi:GNAT superfamily N-acetyltransferase